MPSPSQKPCVHFRFSFSGRGVGPTLAHSRFLLHQAIRTGAPEEAAAATAVAAQSAGAAVSAMPDTLPGERDVQLAEENVAAAGPAMQRLAEVDRRSLVTRPESSRRCSEKGHTHPHGTLLLGHLASLLRRHVSHALFL